MKLTESRIKQIILELIKTMEEQELWDGQQPEKKMTPDVSNIQKLLTKIDTKQEYNELIKIVMKHNFGNDNQKMTILKQLKDLILNMLSK